MPTLTVVPTPVGNLQDITLRAIETLKNATLILAEDTRTTGFLLKHLGISCPMLSYHKFNEHSRVTQLIDRITNEPATVLVSDAGTPGISDPGTILVKACIEAGITVSCLPGPTAFVPALVMSGFATDRFCFEGFLPHKKGRQTKLLQLQDEERTIILYESPHRIVKTLEQILEFIGNRNVAIVREISKIYEEAIRGDVMSVIQHCKQKPLKGEIVLILEGNTK
ncbi:MAG TPA: 16S rRNA (cytidine(1402)-2'-O)-methyltransferase [Bacteroidales bacterium]|jgi:16S rRNA (cytidine1402-2'-O)-methyltransferase|nr:16S rRNA (cytidine(1402)-2'-O)-methyltransferase [Bacteroidales bacterium]HRS19755.1 16S rRNA (cytidine(1402)-2'-O)-methyltransferase [Bacteroidales bacterium]